MYSSEHFLSLKYNFLGVEIISRRCMTAETYPEKINRPPLRQCFFFFPRGKIFPIKNFEIEFFHWNNFSQIWGKSSCYSQKKIGRSKKSTQKSKKTNKMRKIYMKCVKEWKIKQKSRKNNKKWGQKSKK